MVVGGHPEQVRVLLQEHLEKPEERSMLAVAVVLGTTMTFKVTKVLTIVSVLEVDKVELAEEVEVVTTLIYLLTVLATTSMLQLELQTPAEAEAQVRTVYILDGTLPVDQELL